MTGLYEQTGILDIIGSEKRDNKVAEIREELSSENISPMARQSCYDMTPIQLRENLGNSEIYMDPKMYVQLLEGYFNCNIFLFNQERMLLPRFTQSLYKQYRTTPCIFIYEHWGSESDNAKYPQCELIVRWNIKKKDDTQFFFPYESKISRNMNKVFRLLNESYILNKKISEIVFPIPDDMNIVSQQIDSYGKTRCLNVIQDGKLVSILTNPIPPLPVEEKKDEIHKTDKKTALAVLEKLQIQPISQILKNASKPRLIQINSILGNVDISIPVKSSKPLNLPASYEITYPKQNFSSMTIFNQNKKIIRYITEYLLWAFSNYIQVKDINKITDKILAKFAKKTFIIDSEHRYEAVPKIFGKNNSIMRNGQIIVTSQEMLKRLMYVLKLYSIRDIKTLRSYHTRNSISQYYVDITDFDYYPTQIILQGDDVIDKWIQNSKLSFILHKSIVVGQQSPYFFKNDLVVKDKVFLAQNTTSLELALSISSNWQKYGYNSQDYTTSKKYTFTLYSYVNPDDITKLKVPGKEVQNEIRILGYKLNGTPFYTTLLELL